MKPTLLPNPSSFVEEGVLAQFEQLAVANEPLVASTITKAGEIAKEIELRHPDMKYQNLRSIDELMLKSISYIEELSADKDLGQYIYPKLWGKMRDTVAGYTQALNNYMVGQIACIVKVMVDMDRENPVQEEADRPQLSDEEKEKRMINALAPELPNILKNPMQDPQAKIIDLAYDFRDKEKEEIVEKVIEMLAATYKEQIGEDIPEAVLNTSKESLLQSHEVDACLKEGTVSMAELDDAFIKLEDTTKSILDVKELDREYYNVFQLIKWMIWVMPKPLEQYMMQMLRAQQEMQARQMFQNQMDQGAREAMKPQQSPAYAPKGGHGPGSLRAVKGRKK